MQSAAAKWSWRARCPWPVDNDVTCCTIHDSADSFYNENWKTWHRRVFNKLLKSLTLMPLWQENVHRNNTKQLAIVTSQLQVAHSYIDDVTIGQHFEIIGSAGGIKCGFTSVKLSHRNDRCTEYMEPVMYCSMRAGHLGFGGDFLHLYIRLRGLLLTWGSFNPINNHMTSKIWDEIIHSFPKFNGVLLNVFGNG